MTMVAFFFSKKSTFLSLGGVEVSKTRAEANAQTKIENQSIEVTPGPKKIVTPPRFI